MALKIPDIVIVDTLNMIFNMLRSDHAAQLALDKEHRSLLHLFFSGVSVGKYDLLENIKKTILTTPEDPNHISAQLSFDQNTQASAPMVWVTLPSENNRNNSLATGLGNVPEILLAGDTTDSYIEQYNYRWATTYQVVIGSNNKNETTALYHLVKAMLVQCIGHMEMEGLSNMKIGGGDIRFPAQVALPLFTKAITLNFEYEQNIPESYTRTIYRKLRLYWRPEDAVIAQGPIEVSLEDNVDSDFDSAP